MTSHQFPAWNDLPTIDLYLDQVLILINETTYTSISPLTASMINNYVKHRYVPKPNKKKYTRSQIAYLILINYLKTVFSVQEVAELLSLLTIDTNISAIYDTFVKTINNDKYISPDIITKACETIKHYQKTKLLLEQMKAEVNRQ